MGITGTQTAGAPPGLDTGMAAVRSRIQTGGKGRPILTGAGLVIVGALAGWMWRGHKDNPTIATVNGVTIRAAEFNHRCQIAAGPQVLKQMLGEELAIQFADKQGVLPSNADVQAKYDEAAKQPNFDKQLAASHQTPDDLKRSILVNLTQQNVYGKGVQVSDADIKAFYDANTDPRNAQARYYQPDKVQIAAIISDNQNDINNALHELASGTAFARVAAKYSKDRSSQNGGLLPAIRRGSIDARKLPGLENTVFNMRPGQQIDNFHIGKATWIIRCVAKQPETRIPFDKVKEECRTGAMLAKGIRANGQKVQADSQQFQKDAQISITAPEFKDMVVKQ